MEDFIFGTLATDDLKLLHHRVEAAGIHHNHRLSPRDPRPGEAVTIQLTTGSDIHAEKVACYFTTDGTPPEGSKGTATHGEVVPLRKKSVHWDSFIWGYVITWEGELPPLPEGTLVTYRIGAWNHTGKESFADWPDIKYTTDKAATAVFSGQDFPTDVRGDQSGTTFAYQVDTHDPPAWAHGAMIYHIFVDRFYPGDGHDWIQRDNVHQANGGTLWGVRDKLDYIQSLGAKAIWLSPIHPAGAYHGYDVTDYMTVADSLGGDEALHALVESAHERNIKVILDLVCNHLSYKHPRFQSALNDPLSPYRDYFFFDDSEHGYRSFFNVVTMPEINLNYPPARDWMLDIARHWISVFDVDGYRLDHANGPGPDFWTHFSVACRQLKPDFFTFGEVVDAPSKQIAYTGRLDGLLDFSLADVFRRTYAYRTWNKEQLADFLEQHHTYFEGQSLRVSFLDNHDMDRFLHIAEDNVEALKQAASHMRSLNLPFVLYYGTEIGLIQPTGREEDGLEAGRLPMIWDEAKQNTDLLDFFRASIR